MLWGMGLLLTAALCSCSKQSYLNAIPAESTLVISMNPDKMSGADNALLLKSLLKLKTLDNTGLNLSENIYFFEDAQGNLGLCAKIADEGKLENMLTKQGLAINNRGEAKFCTLPSRWMCGMLADAMLLMGPVTPAQEGDMMALMEQYLQSDEEQGLKASPIYGRLDSIDAPMALVCQSTALPEQMMAPFTLGAPKTADAADVMIGGGMEVKDGCLWVDGRTFSFNDQVNDSIAAAIASFRPIGQKYLSSMADGDAMGLFLNVEGPRYVRLMQQSKSFKQMLMGINAAIDMDNILKSINGDMALITPRLGDKSLQIKLAAQLDHADWLADVDYWKKSVPKGGTIGDWGPQRHYYRGDGMSYYFGVTDDNQYLSGGSEEQAMQSIKPAAKPIAKNIQDKIKGQKMAMVLNLSALEGEKAKTVTGLLKPMFGNLKAIVYTMK